MHGNEQGHRSYQTQQSLSIYKICLSGKLGVGKTEIFKLLSGQKTEEQIGFDCFEYKVSGFPAKIHVYDTAGLEQHGMSLTRSNYYRGVHVIVLVYDLTDRESLYYLEKEMKDLQSNEWINEATRLVLIRNKEDEVSRLAVSTESEKQFIQNRSQWFQNLVHSIAISAKTEKGEQMLKKLFWEDMPNILGGQEAVVKEDVFKDLNHSSSLSGSSSCC